MKGFLCILWTGYFSILEKLNILAPSRLSFDWIQSKKADTCVFMVLSMWALSPWWQQFSFVLCLFHCILNRDEASNYRCFASQCRIKLIMLRERRLKHTLKSSLFSCYHSMHNLNGTSSLTISSATVLCSPSNTHHTVQWPQNQLCIFLWIYKWFHFSKVWLVTQLFKCLSLFLDFESFGEKRI